MPETPQSPKERSEEQRGVIYVSLYRGEPVSYLSDQIRGCLQMDAVRQQATIEIRGDIEDPHVSVGDISLSYPPYELTIVEISPHNGKWSGFRLLATRRGDNPA